MERIRKLLEFLDESSIIIADTFMGVAQRFLHRYTVLNFLFMTFIGYLMMVQAWVGVALHSILLVFIIIKQYPRGYATDTEATNRVIIKHFHRDMPFRRRILWISFVTVIPIASGAYLLEYKIHEACVMFVSGSISMFLIYLQYTIDTGGPKKRSDFVEV